jgi:hypothetical protein
MLACYLPQFYITMKQGNPVFQLRFQHIVEQAKTLVLENGNHAPILIVGDGQRQIVMELPRNADTPHAQPKVMYQAGMQLARRGNLTMIQEVFFISEGQVSVFPGESSRVLVPIHSSVWKDALFIAGLDVSRYRTRLAVYEMQKNDMGKVTKLKRLVRQANQENPFMNAVLAGYTAVKASKEGVFRTSN